MLGFYRLLLRISSDRLHYQPGQFFYVHLPRSCGLLCKPCFSVASKQLHLFHGLLFYRLHCSRDQVDDSFIHIREFLKFSLNRSYVNICENIYLADSFLDRLFKICICKPGTAVQYQWDIYGLCDCTDSFKIQLRRQLICPVCISDCDSQCIDTSLVHVVFCHLWFCIKLFRIHQV